MQAKGHVESERASVMPETSTTLLRDVADADNPRWGEFVARYRPALETFMSMRFPGLDPDDLIQETFIAVANALPAYRYVPEEKGHFRNFLTGILHHKALNALRSSRRREERNQEYSKTMHCENGPTEDGERHWRESLYEIALQQLLSDPDLAGRNKQIFIRTAIKGEKPEAVAESLAVSRAVVDQTKKRMVDRLRALIDALKRAYDN